MSKFYEEKKSVQHVHFPSLSDQSQMRGKRGENKKGQGKEQRLRKSVVLADAQGEQLGWCHDCCACTKLDYYKDYFKVTNEDVKNRIMMNLQFWQGGFFTPRDQDYDFYGPFWLNTTVVFCLSAVHNIVRYQVQEPFQYSFSAVGLAFAFVYLWNFLMPVAFYFILKCLGVESSIMQMICLYGYSMATYIPAILLCSVNVCILSYLLLGYAGGAKVGFVFKNLFAGDQVPSNKKIPIMVFILLEAGVQFLVFKIAFVICPVAPSHPQAAHHQWTAIRNFDI